MQLCIVFAIIASFVAADLAPVGDVDFGAPKLAAVLLVQILVVLVAWAVALQTRADRASDGYPKEAIIRRLELRSRWHLGTWAAAVICILTCFDWPRIVNSWQPVESTFWQPVLLLLPILAPLFGSWAVMYQADRALDHSIEKQTCCQYVLAQARCYVLVPLIPILIVLTWLHACDRFLPVELGTWLTFAVRASLLVVLACAFPLMLRLLWRTESMHAGPLRRILEERCEQYSFEARDILIWHTDNRMLNAAVAGLLPQMRYVLLTDRLIRDLSSTDVEYVFLHEIAHAKLCHSWKLMASLCGGLAIGCLSTVTIVAELSPTRVESTSVFPLLLSLLAVILICFLFVGRYARLLELQADHWAASKIGDHVLYLRAIASVAFGHPDQNTWLHPSFEQRCQFLLKDAEPASVWLRNRLTMSLALLSVWPIGLALIAVALRSA